MDERQFTYHRRGPRNDSYQNKQTHTLRRYQKKSAFSIPMNATPAADPMISIEPPIPKPMYTYVAMLVLLWTSGIAEQRTFEAEQHRRLNKLLFIRGKEAEDSFFSSLYPKSQV
ncbi:hypothetical protein M5K25_016047 [Dendrobium thyrsiflorum]|uniref:Uncharacterized protein n=1 Tax=Dendrobium thyrsiflorum TaxID=117978 RepID=A0ABD0US10_DENTH